jgi:ankyrin repeat protein
VETVEMLIGLGANTKAKDRYGRTPLQFLSAAEKPPKRKMKTTRALPSSLC